MKIHSFLIRCAVILLCGIILGTLLIICVYSIPGHLIQSKVSASLDMLVEQDLYPFIIPGYEPSKLDNFSEFIMLEMAVFTHHNTIVKNALLNPYHESNEPMDALRSYLNGEILSVNSYSRYWHGYLLYLKPLLLFFSVGTIRLLTGSIQLLLTFLIAIQLNKYRALLPFWVLLVGICFPTVFISLQYTSCSMIALLSTYLILKIKYDGNDQRIAFFLLVTGMSTSFFDFLTFPLLSLILPLSIWLLINSNTFSVKILIFSIIAWGVGYVGMWAGKWFMGTFLTHENLFTEVLDQFKLRTSSTDFYGTDIPLTTGLIYCSKLVFTPVVIFFILVCSVYNLVTTIQMKSFFQFKKTRIAFLSLLFLPAIWMLATCNHSFVHKAYTYRSLASTLLPLLLAFSPLKYDNPSDYSPLTNRTHQEVVSSTL